MGSKMEEHYNFYCSCFGEKFAQLVKFPISPSFKQSGEFLYQFVTIFYLFVI